MLDDIIKTLTRNIIPGLVFVLFVLYIPINLVQPKFDTSTIHPTILVFLGITIGFVLDGMGAYRFTWEFKYYRKLKFNLVTELSKIMYSDDTATIENENLSQISQQTMSDPDGLIASIWLHDRESYESIMEERAEWVSILVSAFCFILAPAVTLLFSVISFFEGNKIIFLNVIGYSIISMLVSYFLSKTGINRMKAHNSKILLAAKRQIDAHPQ